MPTNQPNIYHKKRVKLLTAPRPVCASYAIGARARAYVYPRNIDVSSKSLKMQ